MQNQGAPCCGEFGQNECPGYNGAPETAILGCLAQMWAEGPGGGHYDNMTSQQFTSAACGIHVLPDGTFWAIQNFR